MNRFAIFALVLVVIALGLSTSYAQTYDLQFVLPQNDGVVNANTGQIRSNITTQDRGQIDRNVRCTLPIVDDDIRSCLVGARSDGDDIGRRPSLCVRKPRRETPGVGTIVGEVSRACR